MSNELSLIEKAERDKPVIMMLARDVITLEAELEWVREQTKFYEPFPNPIPRKRKSDV